MTDHNPGELIAGIIDEFEQVNTAREHALGRSRHVIRASANAIRAAHRGDIDDARSGAAEQLVERDPNVNRSLLLRLIAGVRGL